MWGYERNPTSTLALLGYNKPPLAKHTLNAAFHLKSESTIIDTRVATSNHFINSDRSKYPGYDPNLIHCYI
jgi:hypothetical protein